MLSADGGRRVVQVPCKGFLSYDETALARIGALTGWHPPLIQLLCSEIYAMAKADALTAPWLVSKEVVDTAATRPAENILLIWRDISQSLGKQSLILDVLRVINSYPINEIGRKKEILTAQGVSEPVILNQLQMRSTRIDNPVALCQVLEIPLTDHLPTLVPRIIHFLAEIGMIATVGDQPPKYRIGPELLLPYIELLSAESPHLRTTK
jgi:hypothetical protein